MICCMVTQLISECDPILLGVLIYGFVGTIIVGLCYPIDRNNRSDWW